MKELIVALLFGCATVAHAEVLPLQNQYAAPNGLTTEWTDYWKTGGCKSDGQCWKIPVGKRILGCSGTQSIKAPGIELLARIVAGNPSGLYMPIWTGHHLSSFPTVHIDTPPLDIDDSFIVGDGTNSVWIEYQISNSGPSTAPGGGWEMQATCTAGTGGTVITIQQ